VIASLVVLENLLQLARLALSTGENTLGEKLEGHESRYNSGLITRQEKNSRREAIPITPLRESS
jgi:hypothetical protein